MMITTESGKVYKLAFYKRPAGCWEYEYHIILRAVKNTVWDKYCGFIGKFKRTSYRKNPKPFASIYRDLSNFEAPNLNELKKLVAEKIKQLYDQGE